MLERFGFTGDRLTARIGDLSGGERRRFQLLRLLLSEPNVLLLDEPTNDLDIETLTVLEDFLDDWPGTLVVVSHDRYFLERGHRRGLRPARRRPDLPAAAEAWTSTSPAEGASRASSHRLSLRPFRPGRAGSSVLARGARRSGSPGRRWPGWRSDSSRWRPVRPSMNAEVLAHASRPRAARCVGGRLAELTEEREALEAEWLEAAEQLE
jgi:ATP-binding cassette subfamily F protein uup